MTEKIPVMIAVLARVAWADGKLLPQEAEFFRETIAGLNLSPELELQAWQAVVSPTGKLDEADLALLSAEDRRFIADISQKMATADGQLSYQEQRVLQQLGLSPIN